MIINSKFLFKQRLGSAMYVEGLYNDNVKETES